MMAYQNDFVLCILHSGSPVREINGKVTLPFNSEYKIRLKNKHNYLRAKARVWIDGRKASNLGDFILKAGETLDLERFLDESLSSGNRFQFVPLSDRRVNDPTEENNGIVKVEFYREIDYLRGWTIDPWPVKPLPSGPPISPSPQPWRWDDHTGNPLIGGSRESTSGDFGVNNVRSTITCNFVSNSNTTFTSNQAGATVEGGRSGQEFSVGNDFFTETYPVTLTLKLQGPKDNIVSKKVEERKPAKVRFCSACGAKRMRKARFCHRCGHSFKKLL